MHRTHRIIPLILLFMSAASGCAHHLGWAGPLTTSNLADRGPLDEAVQRYYTATTAEALRVAAQDALRVAPLDAMAHEVAADLARFEGDLEGQVSHLLAALADTTSDATRLHLLALGDLRLTSPERHRALARALQLTRNAADPAVVSAAASFAASLFSQSANYGPMEALVVEEFPPLSMALIGTWDNDQGKGFETIRPPEEGIDLAAVYQGSVVDIRWRTDPPRSRQGDLSLDSLMSPSNWATAYATAVIDAEMESTQELRMTTSSPFKVWLNGQLIASVEERRATVAFDGYVLPLPLQEGSNRLLIKLAHRKGTWLFRPRLTGPGGATPSGVQLAPAADKAVTPRAVPELPVRGAEGFIAAHTTDLKGPPARVRHLTTLWAERLGLQAIAIGLAEDALEAHPEAIVASYLLAGLHWDQQERGQAADKLGELDRRVGEELPHVRAQQARFWIQQGRKNQARDHLMMLRDAYPKRAAVWLQIAGYFKAEGWHHERCEALEEANSLRPRWPHGLSLLGDCQSQLSGQGQAKRTFSKGLEEAPGNHTLLKRLREIHQRAHQWTHALSVVKRMIIGWPTSYSARMKAGDLHRRLGHPKDAQRRYEEAIAIDPAAAWAHKRLGALAREQGELDQAVAHWQDALTRNPDDNMLSRYVRFHGTGDDEAWLVDVPDPSAIEQAIIDGREATPPPGADTVALIDHRVMQLFKDGSRAGVVTQVVLAVNEQGRDRITSMHLAERGRVQVLNAYASNPDGERIEATRPRDGKVRFRALQDRSVVVLQYRFDSGPQPYLALHMAELWSFHAAGWATAWSEWALWLDTDEVVHEQGLGSYTRDESAHGPLKRISWSMRGVAPLIPEPGAPSVLEVMNHVMVSTVPSWETFMRWEAALLAGAFRADPQIEALASRLVTPNDTAAAKVSALHNFVMNEIRYEQDYENTIAGVKPHAAPVVLERRYGDCKDKAVLFITLARLVGLEAHFAVLKTRPKGPVYKDVPYQQFDHAIVYVPAQEGIDEGRFYDPTADALDLDVLRQDDAGTLALVFNPADQTHAWIPIPFQAPTAHHGTFDLDITLKEDGSAEGTLTVRGRGTMGSRLRQGARNKAKFEKWIQGLVGVLAPGATVDSIRAVEVTDLTKDAELKATFKAPDVAQIEGRESSVQLPWTRLYRVSPSYKLPVRRYDLVRGAPETVSLNVRYTLPRGSKVIRLPKKEVLETPCSRFERHVKARRNVVELTTRSVRTCERITPEFYAVQRRTAKRIDELNAEAVVFKR